jgi:hypothetical protein
LKFKKKNRRQACGQWAKEKPQAKRTCGKTSKQPAKPDQFPQEV